jgi:multimeric flavodoxin WrbA
VLILVGSYRTRGNTARLTSLVQDGLVQAAARRNAPLEIETINLGHLGLEPCRGVASVLTAANTSAPITTTCCLSSPKCAPPTR